MVLKTRFKPVYFININIQKYIFIFLTIFLVILDEDIEGVLVGRQFSGVGKVKKEYASVDSSAAGRGMVL